MSQNSSGKKKQYHESENDSEGIRTPAGRAQWISSPSPEPLGHAVLRSAHPKYCVQLSCLTNLHSAFFPTEMFKSIGANPITPPSSFSIVLRFAPWHLGFPAGTPRGAPRWPVAVPNRPLMKVRARQVQPEPALSPRVPVEAGSWVSSL